MKLIVMTAMKSMSTKIEEILKYVTPNSWTIKNTIKVKKSSWAHHALHSWHSVDNENGQPSSSKEIIRCLWSRGTIKGDDLLNNGSGPVHFSSSYSLLKQAVSIICECHYSTRMRSDLV